MSFQNIRGQDKTIEIIRGYMRQAHLEGSYLFTGPEGVGKKMTAFALAKAVNCSESDLDSCDKCVSCKKIDHGQHPDIHIFAFSEDEIKIEAIRQLQKEISLRPYEGRKKVFIVDNAHNLTPEAQGALLKVLEEPAKDSLIILITDKPALLFKTILSRCKTLKFSPFKRQVLKELLKEEYILDSKTAHFLAYFSEGRLGRALRLKEADALRQKNNIIDQFALSGRLNLRNITVETRDDVKKLLDVLASWFRDIYLLKTGIAHSEMINFDRKEELLKNMNRFSFAQLDQILDSISQTVFYLQRNMNIRLLLYNLGSQVCKG